MKKIVTIALTAMCTLILHEQVSAQMQMENSMSQYYHNKMLWNAGYTGADSSKLYVLQNRGWVGFDGAPIMTSVSGEFLFGRNSALGVHVISDLAGVLRRTFGVLSYAYRVKFSETNSLRLGIGLSVNSDRLDFKNVDASAAMSDPAVANNVNAKYVFDGNFGAVYRARNFDLGFSVFRINANRIGGNDIGNMSVAQIGGTYYFEVGEEGKTIVKPLAMMRFYRNTGNVLDLGFQSEYHGAFNFMLVYQTTGNLRFGAGLRKSGLGELNLFYNSNYKLVSAASQQYELGLGIYMKKKQK